MILNCSRSPSPTTDTILRILPSALPVSFQDTGLQTVYLNCFSGDELTLEHMQIRACLWTTVSSQHCWPVLTALSPALFDDLRQVTANLGTALMEHKAKKIFCDRLDNLTFASEQELLTLITAQLPLCEYCFDRYLTKKQPEISRTVTFSAEEDHTHILAEILTLARSIMTSRDLVNETAKVLTPMELAPTALAEKGITYDTGGLALKQSGMELMCFDMNGTAAVIGAMCAIAEQKLPQNVVTVVAACKNALYVPLL